jgi:hypothetical protein
LERMEPAQRPAAKKVVMRADQSRVSQSMIGASVVVGGGRRHGPTRRLATRGG